VFVSRSEATILHADLDAFYASVEQRDDPRLRGRPVIVGGGVVLAAATRRRRTACARRWAGAGARAVPARDRRPPRMSAYSEASKAVFEVFDDTTPLVEGCRSTRRSSTSRAERIAGTPTEIAARLRRDVLEQVGLPITVGVARTKFLAKVASGVAKPDGLLVVPPDGELAFLHPLPVERLWGVGPVTARSCTRAGSRRSARSRLGRATLVSMLGRASGRHLHALAHNRDPRPVQVGAGAARSARSARSAARRVADERRRRARRPRRPRHAPDARRRTASAAPSCCGCASTTSRARRARTRCRARPRTPQTILATRAAARARCR
jgi:DNA polymerase-4